MPARGRFSRSWTAPVFLLIVGLLHLAGDAFVGRNAPESVPTHLEWSDADGRVCIVGLTQDVFGRLKGPYARRATYRRAFAHGSTPAGRGAPARLARSVVEFAFCGDGEFLRELSAGCGPPSGPAYVRYGSDPGGESEDPAAMIEVRCP